MSIPLLQPATLLYHHPHSHPPVSSAVSTAGPNTHPPSSSLSSHPTILVTTLPPGTSAVLHEGTNSDTPINLDPSTNCSTTTPTPHRNLGVRGTSLQHLRTQPTPVPITSATLAPHPPPNLDPDPDPCPVWLWPSSSSSSSSSSMSKLDSIHRFITSSLRLGEVIFSSVVLGILAKFISSARDNTSTTTTDTTPSTKAIYILTLSCVSLIFACFCLITSRNPPRPTPKVFRLLDGVFTVNWFVAFAFLVQMLDAAVSAQNNGDGGGGGCDTNPFHWGEITMGGDCQRWKAIQAFAWLDSWFFFGSLVLGVWEGVRGRRVEKGGDDAGV